MKNKQGLLGAMCLTFSIGSVALFVRATELTGIMGAICLVLVAAGTMYAYMAGLSQEDIPKREESAIQHRELLQGILEIAEVCKENKQQFEKNERQLALVNDVLCEEKRLIQNIESSTKVEDGTSKISANLSEIHEKCELILQVVPLQEQLIQECKSLQNTMQACVSTNEILSKISDTLLLQGEQHQAGMGDIIVAQNRIVDGVDQQNNVMRDIIGQLSASQLGITKSIEDIGQKMIEGSVQEEEQLQRNNQQLSEVKDTMLAIYESLQKINSSTAVLDSMERLRVLMASMLKSSECLPKLTKTQENMLDECRTLQQKAEHWQSVKNILENIRESLAQYNEEIKVGVEDMLTVHNCIVSGVERQHNAMENIIGQIATVQSGITKSFEDIKEPLSTISSTHTNVMTSVESMTDIESTIASDLKVYGSTLIEEILPCVSNRQADFEKLLKLMDVSNRHLLTAMGNKYEDFVTDTQNRFEDISEIYTRSNADLKKIIKDYTINLEDLNKDTVDQYEEFKSFINQVVESLTNASKKDMEILEGILSEK